MLTGAELRKKYVEYFIERGHRHVSSAPLVPPDDPSLLFTNAGVVQFKPLYTGTVELPYSRATTVQKCLRAGGKDSDLENVGKTLRHHTLFEMLGNFSFGDYFKSEALEWGWDFVRNVMGLPDDRLWGTYFEEDPEAAEILEKEIGLDPSRIIPLDTKENFWGPAGDTGPCGPCSEIIFFMGSDEELEEVKKLDKETVSHRIVEEGDLFLEIWNMVFPQFDHQKDASRPPLKNRGIDTGAGLERMTTAMQFMATNGKIATVYDTDLLNPIVMEAAKLLGTEWARGLGIEALRTVRGLERQYTGQTIVQTVKECAGSLEFEESSKTALDAPNATVSVIDVERKAGREVPEDVLQEIGNKTGNGFLNWAAHDDAAQLPIHAANAVSDHVRAMTFLIGEGMMPSNEGRGSVVRQILRRALRFASLVGEEDQDDVEPFLYRLVGKVVEVMGEAYPEIVPMQSHVEKVIRLEEESFLRTMRAGEKRLQEKLAEAMKSGDKTLKGEDIFELHATFGYHPDMTKEIVEDTNKKLDDADQIAFDAEGYATAMEEHRELARKSWKGEELGDQDSMAQDILEQHGATEFVGHEELSADAIVVGLIVGEERKDEIAKGDKASVLLDRSPFYAESGGQIGDRGALECDGASFVVRDTTKTPAGLQLHEGKLKKGALKVGDKVTVKVEGRLRQATMRNHTATHLLQAALKEVLGQHVTQAGSHVYPNGLRFDFTHIEAMRAEELRRVEAIVNDRIRANLNVSTQVLPKDEAFALGAIAPFGEKYGEIVRVVQVGDYSTEFCGGTHVRATGEIGMLLIAGESSIASGVRRIEALTGEGAFSETAQAFDRLADLGQALSASPEEIIPRVEALQSELRALRKEIDSLKQEQSTGEVDSLIAEAVQVCGAKVIAHQFEGLDAGQLRSLADVIRSKTESSITVLAARDGKKVTLICATSDDLQKKAPAGTIVKEVAQIVGGGGGGRPDMAQAGGKNPEKLPEALAAVAKIVEEKLG